MKPTKRIWQFVIGLAVVALGYQLFFRYSYTPIGNTSMRLDRLTGTLCIMPCYTSASARSNAVAQATYDASVEQVSEQIDQRAISIAQQSPEAAMFQPPPSPDGVPMPPLPVHWAVDTSFNPMPPPPPTDPSQDTTRYVLQSPGFQTRLVCATAPSGKEWCWEVHVDTGDAIFVNNSSYLKQKYGFSTS